MKIERQNKIRTEFGNAKINEEGYYRITSSKEGNFGKLLHRLIFEKYYGSIPEGFVIHHKDEDKTNNCIFNLQLMRKEEHLSSHKKGEKNPNYGKTGEKHHNYKKEARVIRHSKNRQGKVQYGLKYQGKILKRSIFKDKLDAEAERINK